MPLNGLSHNDAVVVLASAAATMSNSGNSHLESVSEIQAEKTQRNGRTDPPATGFVVVAH